MSPPLALDRGQRADVPTVVLIPVKGLDRAKSRLQVFGDAHRRDLALAFVLDTVAAAVSAPGVTDVVVVTEDQVIGSAVVERGVRLEPGGRGLNEDLIAAESVVRQDGPGTRLLVLCSDLPSLRAEDVSSVLARPEKSVAVPDRHYRGTTALMCSGPLEPHFGDGSYAAHRAAGFVAMPRAGPRLRCDVDTPEDLARARALGLGHHTLRADARRPGP